VNTEAILRAQEKPVTCRHKFIPAQGLPIQVAVNNSCNVLLIVLTNLPLQYHAAC